MCNQYLYWAIIIIIVLFLLKQTQLGSRFSNSRILNIGSSENTEDDRPGHNYSGTSSIQLS